MDGKLDRFRKDHVVQQLMRSIFWSMAGTVWFMGHLQFAVKGASNLTTDETWELSRAWAEGKMTNVCR